MDTNSKLTKKLEDIWIFISLYQEKCGYSPSYSEICLASGLKSKRGVSLQLQKLEELMLIKRDPNSRRAIQILRKPSLQSELTDSLIPLPILGEVVAGEPRYAEQNAEGYINVSFSEIKSNKNAFLLKIDGTSMNKLGYNAGDYAIVIPDSTARDGDIVIALDPDENIATIKRFKKLDNYIILIPESYDKKYKPIIGTNYVVQGRVIGKISKEDATIIGEV